MEGDVPRGGEGIIQGKKECDSAGRDIMRKSGTQKKKQGSSAGYSRRGSAAEKEVMCDWV